MSVTEGLGGSCPWSLQLSFCSPKALLPSCLPSSSCSRWHETLMIKKPSQLCGPDLPESSLIACRGGDSGEKSFGCSWAHIIETAVSACNSLVGKDKYKLPLCGSEKWLTHLVTDCLSLAVIRHVCIIILFYRILQWFSLKY